MKAESLALYSFLIFAVSIIPGPSMALALAHGARHGLPGVLPAAIGNVAASLIQGIIAFAAVQSIIALDRQALSFMQIAGAIYIAYVGFLFVRSVQPASMPEGEARDIEAPVSTRFRQGFFIALLNPKAIFFFTALYPQFVADAELSGMTLLLIFGPIGSIALVCFLIYGLAGDLLVALLTSNGMMRWFIPAIGVFLLISSLVVLVDALM